MSNNKKGLPNPGEVNKHVVNPAGWLFNGRFYKSLDDLAGRTMSEGNEPVPLYTEGAGITTPFKSIGEYTLPPVSRKDLLEELDELLTRAKIIAGEEFLKPYLVAACALIVKLKELDK